MVTQIVKSLHHRGLNTSTDYALASDVDAFWLMFGAILVFFMQTGFAMLEVGSVQAKNTKNILIKNIFDAAIGAICFWLFGWGIAFGADDGKDVGTTQYALVDMHDYALWLFQWAFSATAATIVSGAVAERISFPAYFCYAIILCSLIYPFVAHWGWAGGFMSAYRSNEKDDLFMGCGVLDFAGSGVVHMTGGLCALIAVYFLGARHGRFDKETGEPIQVNTPDYSPIFQCLGTLILFMGWFGFNGVSTLAISGASMVAAKAMAATAIAASSGCLACVVLGVIAEGYLDYHLANNGVLAGLVAVTASCATIEMEGAFVIGIVAAIIYYIGSKTLLKYQLDDVVDASPVHFGCGIWGVLAAGFFTTKEGYRKAYYDTYDGGGDRAQHCAGVFYGGSGAQLGANIVFILLIIAWVGGLACLLFFTLKSTIGLRTSIVHERRGLDDAHHTRISQRHFERDIDKFEGDDKETTGLDLDRMTGHGSTSGNKSPRNRSPRNSPSLPIPPPITIAANANNSSHSGMAEPEQGGVELL